MPIILKYYKRETPFLDCLDIPRICRKFSQGTGGDICGWVGEVMQVPTQQESSNTLIYYTAWDAWRKFKNKIRFMLSCFN